MPQSQGLVQRIWMDSGSNTQATACVFIGPTPANVELLLLRREAADPPHRSAFITSMVDGLAQAVASRRDVLVNHDGTYITSIELR
jgi:hypothetical protein